ncbi:MAG: hypothetical protein WDW38_003696 [Sanguina aurantia]
MGCNPSRPEYQATAPTFYQYAPGSQLQGIPAATHPAANLISEIDTLHAVSAQESQLRGQQEALYNKARFLKKDALAARAAGKIEESRSLFARHLAEQAMGEGMDNKISLLTQLRLGIVKKLDLARLGEVLVKAEQTGREADEYLQKLNLQDTLAKIGVSAANVAHIDAHIGHHVKHPKKTNRELDEMVDEALASSLKA